MSKIDNYVFMIAFKQRRPVSVIKAPDVYVSVRQHFLYASLGITERMVTSIATDVIRREIDNRINVSL